MSVEKDSLPPAGAVPAPGEKERGLKTMALVVYGLYMLSCFVGFSGIIGIIVAHLKKGDAEGTFLDSHFSNQIRTFWIAFGLVVVGAILSIVVVGWFVMIGAGIWFLYRTIKGLIRLSDNRAYD